jgi:photosystem II stability/assembly factor-like uncharacterized protein
MIKKIPCLFLIFMLIGCKSSQNIRSSAFSKITTKTIFNSDISIRAIASDNDTVYFAGSDKKIGYVDVKTKAEFELQLNSQSENFEFRSLALTANYVYILSVGNPALLYRYSRNLTDKELVYEEKNEKVFYDSMHFWNDKEGIAIGDPIENCLSVIVTRDSGKTWNKISCNDLPKTVTGEAAFAASNTNICIQGNSCWIVSGGIKSRVFYSGDKGKTWKVYETPIIQGDVMTGIFTADFYNKKIGFISGGNYEKPTQNFKNKAITFNGGKTWKLVGENSGPGYVSCAQFVPNSKGAGIVTVGATGIFYSNNFGNTWEKLSDETNLYTIRFISEKFAIAAGKDKIMELNFD